jgi:hypothetical protein
MTCRGNQAVTGTTDMPRSASSAEAMGKHLWRVSCAWEAILAGDIDSLSNHLELEEWGS